MVSNITPLAILVETICLPRTTLNDRRLITSLKKSPSRVAKFFEFWLIQCKERSSSNSIKGNALSGRVRIFPGRSIFVLVDVETMALQVQRFNLWVFDSQTKIWYTPEEFLKLFAKAPYPEEPTRRFNALNPTRGLVEAEISD